MNTALNNWLNLANTIHVKLCLLLSLAVVSTTTQAVDRNPGNSTTPFSTPDIAGENSGRGETSSGPVLPALTVGLRSFLNGEVTLRLSPTSNTSPDTLVAFTQSGYAIDSNSVFDPNTGQFDFSFPDQERQVPLLPGDYTVSLEQNLVPAVAGLPTACEGLATTTVSVSDSGDVAPTSVELFCGTPTQQLTAAQLSALQAGADFDREPAVISANLFSVCLGNGGSNTIYGITQEPFGGDAVPPSQLGSGVRYVEELLELPTLQNSGGLGLNVFCNALRDSTGPSSVVDVPMWRYLVELDLFGEVHVAGLDETQDGAGSYGDPELLDLLTPYEALFESAEGPFGALEASPTRRLRFLDFSFNTFLDGRWADLWRISTNPFYSVGDIRTTGDFGIVYSFGIQIAVAPDVQALVNGLAQTSIIRIEPDPEIGTNFEGLTAELEFPLNQDIAAVFGPFDIGSLGEDPLILVAEGLPPEVGCFAPGFNLQPEEPEPFLGEQFSPYAGTLPININCVIENNRVTGQIEITNFSLRGLVQLELLDSSGTVVQEQFLPIRSTGAPSEIEYALPNVAPGNYQIRLSPAESSANSSATFGCDDAELSFTAGTGDLALPTVTCSQTTTLSSIGDGVIARCYRQAGVALLHQTANLPSSGTLDCSGLGGGEDFFLLNVAALPSTLDLSNNGLTAEDIGRLRFSSSGAGAGVRQVRLNNNPGVDLLTNEDYRNLLEAYDGIDLGERALPEGDGYFAQCLRRSNVGSADEAQAFSAGQTLDCTDISGPADFDSLAGYMNLTIIREAPLDFSDSSFTFEHINQLNDAVQFRGPRPSLDLTNTPGLGQLGNLLFVELQKVFEQLEFGSQGFPSTTFIKPAVPQSFEAFGTSVSLNETGDLLAASAPLWDNPSVQSDLGRVLIFERNNGGPWIASATIFPPVTGQISNAQFGETVALDPNGEFLAITRRTSSGRDVDIYERQANGAWQLEDSVSGTASLGTALRFDRRSGRVFLVATEPETEANGRAAAGEVELFRRALFAGTWASWSTLQAPINASGSFDRFGSALTISPAGTLFVGAPGDDSFNDSFSPQVFDTPLTGNTNTNTGAVYSFSPANTHLLFPSPNTYIKGPRLSSLPLLSQSFGSQLAINEDDLLLAESGAFVRADLFFVNNLGPLDSERINGGSRILLAAGDLILRSIFGSPDRLELIGAPNSQNNVQILWDYPGLVTPAREGADFGRSMAISDDSNAVVIGAPGDDSGVGGIGDNEGIGSSVNSGAVYVYP